MRLLGSARPGMDNPTLQRSTSVGALLREAKARGATKAEIDAALDAEEPVRALMA
eukprot:COSAG06_NODE_43174_length_374_cov_1.105455_1_plen_54_part_01